MACYHPQTVYRSKDGPNQKTGKWPIVFNKSQGIHNLTLEIPCGKCIGCRLERSRQWAIRCVHEASMYNDNRFVTLTYNDENLDKKGSLDKRDFVLFMKRLRKEFEDERKIRFFHCAEYGEICKHCQKHKTVCTCGNYTAALGRPHHHAILFNVKFTDETLLSVRRGVNYMPPKHCRDCGKRALQLLEM